MPKIPRGGFKQNDIVTWAGWKGIVATSKAPNPDFPVQIVFMELKKFLGFRADGSFGGTVNCEGKMMSWSIDEKVTFLKRPRASLLGKLKSLFQKKQKPKAVVNEPEPPKAA